LSSTFIDIEPVVVFLRLADFEDLDPTTLPASDATTRLRDYGVGAGLKSLSANVGDIFLVRTNNSVNRIKMKGIVDEEAGGR